MNEEQAINLAKQYLKRQGRSQQVAGSVRIGPEKIQQASAHFRAKGDIHVAEKMAQIGPHWAIHFKIPSPPDEGISNPDVNIVTVYDNETVEERNVL